MKIFKSGGKFHRSLFILFVCLSFLLSVSSCRKSNKNTKLEKELVKLDEIVAKEAEYDRQKQQTIDSIKNVLKLMGSSPGFRRWELYHDLGDEYRGFLSDSSVVYHTRARNEAFELGNDSLLLVSRINRINALSAAGLFSPAEKELKEIDTVGLPLEIKIKYALTGRQLYTYMTSYSQHYGIFYPDVDEGFRGFTDYVIQNMDSDDPIRRVVEYEEMIAAGKYAQARPLLEELMREVPDNSGVYGRAAYQLAQTFRNEGDEDDYARALTMATQSDLIGNRKEGVALPILAEWLYNYGDNSRAYDYINQAMKDANEGNARMRTGMIAKARTLIHDAYKQEVEDSKTMITVFLLITILLLIVAGELIQYSYKRKLEADMAQSKLSNLNRRQDAYIGHFIALCANYSERLNNLSMVIERKISSGQTDELLKMVRTGKFADAHDEEFYGRFDNVFLNLYPHFVTELNKLLRSDSQIEIPEGGPLTAELRIYAFVRLGVNESVKISRILRYSTATVYTYRNRMRNRAINRETFEEDIMKIGLIGGI